MKKIRKISQAKKKKFVKGATQIVDSHGGVPIEDYLPTLKKYEMDTRAGRMTVSIDTDPTHIFTVYCKFDDPEEAVHIAGPFACNPYSGKYNFHITNFGTIDDIDDIVKAFGHHIKRVVAL